MGDAAGLRRDFVRLSAAAGLEELPHNLFDVGVLGPESFEGFLDALETQCLVLFWAAVLVFLLPVTLDFLAAVPYFDQPERRRGAFEEVTERGKVFEILFFPVARGSFRSVPISARMTRKANSRRVQSLFVRGDRTAHSSNWRAYSFAFEA